MTNVQTIGAAVMLAACSPSPDGNAAAPVQFGNASEVVQTLPAPSSTSYPPCSPTVQDHCTQR